MSIPSQVVDILVEWIDENLDKSLQIEEISRHAGYSKRHLQRIFLQHKGESLGRYIRHRKLHMAMKELLISERSIYDICIKYGYESQQGFTRIFSREYNIPPGAYRNENRRNNGQNKY